MRARLLLAAATLVAFGASLGSGFHFDDYAIFDHPALANILTLRETRPLTYLTFWLNYALGGASPIGYHAVNLALHIGAVLLAFECLRRLLDERAALVAAAVFAIHPIQAEAVDYIWARSIVLATLLCLASLYEWLNGRRWVAVAWFAAALCAKEEVAAFPLVLLLLPGAGGACPAPTRKDRGLPQIAAMLALALAAAARTVYALQVTPGLPAGLRAGIAPARYFLAQGPVILRYLRLLVIPYGFTVDPEIAMPPVWLGLLAWVAVAALAVLAWRYAKWALAGLILLIPSSTVFPAADLAADRRLYFPVLAFAAAAAPYLMRMRLAEAVPAVLIVLSFFRTQVWMSDRALWTEAVERAPDKVRPKIQLARALPASAALELLAKAHEQAPHDPDVDAESGRILLAEGQADAALTEFGRAVALSPRDARYLNDRGVALEALGQTAAARADFEQALRIDPSLDAARDNLKKISGATNAHE
jgi:protein O-mannosyl-transferase